jgi:hypothetical protein
MSITTVSPLKNGQKSPPSFLERSLPGLGPSSTLQSGVYAYIDPSHKQVAYTEYIANFAAFMKATATGQKIGTKEKGYPFKFDPANLIPLSLPTIAFRLSGTNAARLAKFKEDYPRSGEVTFAGKDVLVLPSPTLEDIRTISVFSDLEVYTPANTTNIRGIQSYLTVVKFITVASMVHTYPGYQQKDDMNAYHPDQPQHALDLLLSVTTPCTSSNRLETGEFEPLSGRQKQPRPIYKHEYAFPSYHAVSSAKPAPLNFQVNAGSAGSCPNMPGFAMPWFQAMLLPDTYAISNIIHKYFHANFGEDDESSSTAFNLWRKEIGNWYRTPQGLALQHILFGLDLALTAQLRQYIVIESGVYQGFVLLGENALVVAQGRIHRPISAAALRPLIKGMSAHIMAVENMARLLSEMTLEEGGTEAVAEDSLTSGRRVYNEISKRVVGSDITEEIEKLIAALAFPEDYVRPSVETITQLIKAIGLEDPSWFEDKPMFLHRKKYRDTSVEYRCLSAFGPTAPSFHNTSGSMMRFDDASLDEVNPSTNKLNLPFIPMFMKEITTACVDWRRMRKEQALHVNLLERAVNNRAIVWREKARDEMWKSLKEYLKPKEEKKDTGKKRARGDDEDDEMGVGTSKRSKVVSVFSLDDF